MERHYGRDCLRESDRPAITRSLHHHIALIIETEGQEVCLSSLLPWHVILGKRNPSRSLKPRPKTGGDGGGKSCWNHSESVMEMSCVFGFPHIMAMRFVSTSFSADVEFICGKC